MWRLRDLLHLLLQVSVLYLLDLILLTLAFPFFPFQFKAFLFLQHLLTCLLLLPPSLLLFLQQITWHAFNTVSSEVLSLLGCDTAVRQLTLAGCKALQSSQTWSTFPVTQCHSATVPHPTEVWPFSNTLCLRQYQSEFVDCNKSILLWRILVILVIHVWYNDRQTHSSTRFVIQQFRTTYWHHLA